MLVRVKIVEAVEKFVDIKVDSLDELEIRSEVDRLMCDGSINMDRADSYACDVEVVEVKREAAEND